LLAKPTDPSEVRQKTDEGGYTSRSLLIMFVIPDRIGDPVFSGFPFSWE